MSGAGDVAGSRWWSQLSPAQVAGASAGLVLAVGIAVARGMREDVGGDFHVFWQAGRNFFTGAPLYHGNLPGARNFIYPPFAAFVFQGLAVFPLQVAATIFSFLNIALFVVTGYLTRAIVQRTFPEANPARLPLVLAVVCAGQFFLNNFNLVQVNEVIFVLILLGIRAALHGRDVEAATWLVAATAIKITPVFVVIWLVLRGRHRVVPAIGAMGVACIVVPLAARGPATGAAELGEYYHSFLQGFQGGAVGTGITNQNLGALVYRLVRPAENAEHLDYQLVAVPERTAALIYRAAAALLLVVFVATLYRLRTHRAPVTAFELSTVFLASHLLSPITRKAHLVTLLFVFYNFLAIRPATLPRPGRFAVIALWACIAATGLSGRDLFGRTIYYYVGGYSVAVWTMLLLFIAAVVLVQRSTHSTSLVPAPAG